MQVVIIEDEKPAAEKLEKLIKRYDEKIEIVARLDSIKNAINWFTEPGNNVDLIFMDIQLRDGLSFEIFKRINITKPIIFTTAFDEYALQAFQVSSVDYLLKPVSYSALEESMKKLESLSKNLPEYDLDKLSKALSGLKIEYKQRFMVKMGDHIRSVTVDKVLLFFADGRNVLLVNDQNRKSFLDYKLEELEDLLDPAIFFRVNRSYIININYISDVLVYSGRRLKVRLEPKFESEIIVSREKVLAFKDWFNGI
ncbi:LytR/AlgR family response regulator transcription factor [Bacteroidota bacterium]